MSQESESRQGDRRAYPRVEMRVPISYRVIASLRDMDLDPLAEEIVEQNTVNLSAGGACIRVDERLDHDHIVLIMFQLPGLPDPVKAVARVVWCHEEGAAGFQVGLQYISLTEEQIDGLRKRLRESGGTQ